MARRYKTNRNTDTKLISEPKKVEVIKPKAVKPVEKTFYIEDLIRTDEFSGYSDIISVLFDSKDKKTKTEVKAAIKKHRERKVN